VKIVADVCPRREVTGRMARSTGGLVPYERGACVLLKKPMLIVFVAFALSFYSPIIAFVSGVVTLAMGVSGVIRYIPPHVFRVLPFFLVGFLLARIDRRLPIVFALWAMYVSFE